MDREDQSKKNESFSLSDLSPEILKQIHQLEEPVSLEIQANYFKQSIALRSLGYGEQVEKFLIIAPPERVLFKRTYDDDSRRMALSLLGASTRVEAFRIIEDFLQIIPPSHLRDWALLAQLEARVSITSELLNERQIAITTGLGGHDGKMRFMGLLFTNKLQSFAPFEQDLLAKELAYRIEQAEGEVEHLETGENHLLGSFLLPINNQLKVLFEDTIAECNQYGNFLADSFLITNSKMIGAREVQKILEKYASKKNIDPAH